MKKKFFIMLTTMLVFMALVSCDTDCSKQQNLTTVAKKYTVTFDFDGGFDGDVKVTATFGQDLPKTKVPTKNYYKFNGYYNAKNSLGTQYYDKDGKGTRKWDIKKDTTLYAGWIEKDSYRITYKNIDGATNPNSELFKESESVTLSNATKPYYTFDGWFDASTDGTKVTGWNAGDRTADVTLWARWSEITHTITYYNIDGVDNSSNPTTFNESEKIELNNPTKDGNYFCFWYDASTDGNKVIGWNPGDRTADVTLWSRWIQNGFEEECGDIVLNGDRLLKTSMVTVLETTTDFPCDQSKGAFINERGTVRLSPYAIGRYEVTQALFNVVMKENPSKWTAGNKPLDSKNGVTETDTLLRPVEQVNWYGAIAFCNKLSLLLGKTPCYSVSGITDWANLAYSSIPTSKNVTWNAVSCNFNADGYRLPTEAEWECAARGGKYSTTTPWTFRYAGSDSASFDKYCWYSSNSRQHTWEVGLKRPNSIDLYDMSGNVLEWCWDWDNSNITIDDEKYKKDGVVVNPAVVTPSNYKVLLGGHYNQNNTWCQVDYYDEYAPYGINYIYGFRIAQSLR